MNRLLPVLMLLIGCNRPCPKQGQEYTMKVEECVEHTYIYASYNPVMLVPMCLRYETIETAYICTADLRWRRVK